MSDAPLSAPETPRIGLLIPALDEEEALVGEVAAE